jgi:diacylglycerol kinase family enzyme
VSLLQILFIVNSAASSVTARRRVVIQKALSADHDVTHVETSRRGHATRLAMQAAQDGVDVVAVLGGDGTLNEAANGLAGSYTALAALPGGSTNVFSRIQGLPDDPVDAAGVLLDALDRKSIERIGLGSVDGRYFLFHCGVGFDAAVVEQVERRGPWKRWAGHPLFVYAAIDTWIRGVDRRRPAMRVLAGDGTELARGFLTVVLNANPYTFLGNRAIDLVPSASLDRPLAVVTLRRLKLTSLLSVAARALSRGDVTGHRAVTVHTDIESLAIEAEPSVPYQVDGDHLGSAARLEFRWHPESMALVVP